MRINTYQEMAQKGLVAKLAAADIRAKIEQLRPNLAKTTYREGLMELKAPQAGTVKDLATTTEGAVVQPGSVILTLVPPNGPNNGSGNNTASQVATYKARIALEQQFLTSPQGEKLQAGAGMQVAADIHQGRRTVLEYLISPVAKALQEAGREK
jgi:hemolysin D